MPFFVFNRWQCGFIQTRLNTSVCSRELYTRSRSRALSRRRQRFSSPETCLFQRKKYYPPPSACLPLIPVFSCSPFGKFSAITFSIYRCISTLRAQPTLPHGVLDGRKEGPAYQVLPSARSSRRGGREAPARAHHGQHNNLFRHEAILAH